MCVSRNFENCEKCNTMKYLCMWFFILHTYVFPAKRNQSKNVNNDETSLSHRNSNRSPNIVQKRFILGTKLWRKFCWGRCRRPGTWFAVEYPCRNFILRDRIEDCRGYACCLKTDKGKLRSSTLWNMYVHTQCTMHFQIF